MRKKGLLAACGALVFVGLVTAGAAAPPTPGASLPTTSPLEHLIATGELPKDVTGQPGVWNFAGPASACPGPGWNCTTLGVFPVVQTGTVNVIQCVGVSCSGNSQTGYVNTFECVGGANTSADTNQACTGATQTGTKNEYRCKLKIDAPMATQDCTWNQTGTGMQSENKVSVLQLHEPMDASAQCVVQTASGVQTGHANELKVLQTAKQQSTIGEEQTQEARAAVDADQTATASKNYSDIQQYQDQVMSGDAHTQRQNTGDLPTGCSAPTPLDCAAQLPPLKDIEEPTTCVNLDQNAAAGGTNLSSIHQKVQEVARTTHVGIPAVTDPATPAEPTTQQQGSGSGALPTGGNEGRVHQFIGSLGPPVSQSVTGTSTSDVQQSTQQLLVAPPPAEGGVRDQRQYEDPDCCGFSQDGGKDRLETIDQQVDQHSDAGGFQASIATSSSRSSGSTCTHTHSLSNNVDSSSRSATEEPCLFLIFATECTSGTPPSDGDSLTILENGEGCTEAPPVTSCPEGTEFIPGEGCVPECPEGTIPDPFNPGECIVPGPD